MATGPEHYAIAAGMLVGLDEELLGNLKISELIAVAQVHATLALAAASAQNIRQRGAVGFLDVDIADGWREVLR